MDLFLFVLAVAFGIFGLLVAVTVLRQRRHPDAGCSGGQGCAHHGGRIKCTDCPTQAEGGDDPA